MTPHDLTPERIWADQDNLTWVEADPAERMKDREMVYVRADLTSPPEDGGALAAAERFISGFEGDEAQEGIADLLTVVRAAISGKSQASQAAIDVLAERRRQMAVESWTPEHDDTHDRGEMARAAACYAITSPEGWDFASVPCAWPWDDAWWKPATPRRDLVRAGALILAEIERLDRAALAKHKGGA